MEEKRLNSDPGKSPSASAERTTRGANSGTPAARVPAGRVPSFHVDQQQISSGFFSNLRDFLAERPVKLPRSAAAGSLAVATDRPGFFEELKETFTPGPR